MEPAHITGLLKPFLGPGGSAFTEAQAQSISMYIDILTRWNARINLTSISQPEEIVTRHFGESLFAARHLFPHSQTCHPERSPSGSSGGVEGPCVSTKTHTLGLLDIGSGAGFPGLPVKLWAPDLSVRLIESNQRKAVFLREVIRALRLTDIDVFAGRAEDFPGIAHTVTLRAVERFEAALPVAASLVAPNGRLALLIGLTQVEFALRLAAPFHWSGPVAIPQSSSRILLIGTLGT
jgi:16S rRNA (guanine527-N7)-methyltransferase